VYVTLHQALAGSYLRSATSGRATIDAAHLRDFGDERRPRPPRSLNHRIPRDLETICLKAMAKEPGRRYQGAREFGDDLRRFLKGEPIQARPVSRGEKLWRWCHRNPVVASLVTAVAFSLLIGIGISSYFAVQSNERAVEALTHAKRADANAAQLRTTLYIAQMNLAEREWERGNVAHVLELLEVQHPKQAGETDLRGWEWYYQERLCHDDLRTLHGHSGAVNSVTFSPDGTRLASASADNTVKLWDTASGQELRTLHGHSSVVNSVMFSPDGTRLASASGELFSPDGTRRASASADNTVKLWDAASGQELRALHGHSSMVTSVAFSPDGTRLASASADNTVKLWDAASGQELRTLHGHSSMVTSVAFSPDGTRLASAEFRTVKLWDAASGQELRTFHGHFFSVVVFSPDGTRLASASFDNTVKVWDAASGQELRTLPGHSNMVTSVVFSPDGTRLASASWDNTVKLWDAASGQELRTFHGHSSMVHSVVFSPDGTRLASASADNTVKLWDAASGLRILHGHSDVVNSVVFSPDGTQLASASRDNTVKLWDAHRTIGPGLPGP
jgi:WD40 repeat protein